VVLKLRQSSPDDWKQAKCRNIRPTPEYDPFFDEEDEEEAVNYCNGEADGVLCPVRHECLLYAMINNCREGVWGGTSPLTRKAIRKKFPVQEIGKPEPQWEWMSEDDALNGLDKSRLKKELYLETMRENR
jgi:hypothetical protein